jgi:hypothetical protein
MAPTRSDSGQLSDSKKCAATAVMPVNTTTPRGGEPERRFQAGPKGFEFGAQTTVQQNNRQCHVAHPKTEPEIVKYQPTRTIRASQGADNQKNEQK